MLHTSRNPALIRIAWGPRRATSSTRYGTVESAYPREVTASLSLWAQWVRSGLWRWLTWRWQVVVPPSRAVARVREAIAGVSKPGLGDDEIARLTAARAAHRAAGEYAEADRIRDHLRAHGVEVRDGHKTARD